MGMCLIFFSLGVGRGQFINIRRWKSKLIIYIGINFTLLLKILFESTTLMAIFMIYKCNIINL